MAGLIPVSPKLSFQNASGGPLANGTLTVYLAGTDTPTPTWQDEAQTVLNNNPIVLDARGECTVWLDSLLTYKFLLNDSGGATIWTVDNISGAQTNPGLQDGSSILDFPGATTDLKFTAVKAAGVKWVRFPSGSYTTITGFSVAQTDTLEGIHFEQGAKIIVTSSTNVIGIDIQKTDFKITGQAHLTSSGNSTDGNNTTGIRIGRDPAVGTAGGRAFVEIEAIWHQGFSYAGVATYEPVYNLFGRIEGTLSNYGTVITDSFFGPPTNARIIGTTVKIGAMYQSNCIRALFINNSAWIDIDMCIAENCGSNTVEEGAFHFVNANYVVIKTPYTEACRRNIVRHDSPVIFIGGNFFPADVPDVVTYTAVAADNRGSVRIDANAIYARRIKADIGDTQNLTIGENLIVPIAAGSVQFGNETMLSYNGLLTNATWTTVATLPAAEITGAPVNGRAMYEYTCYAGAADLSTGFDSGTIFNSTLRSYTGATPAWLRLSSNLVQMNVTSSSYGLTYKIVLRRIYPG